MRIFLSLCVWLPLTVLTACATPSYLPEATSLTAAADEVIVIGKFELDPPMQPELEQETYWNVIGDDQLLNSVIVATAPQPEQLDISTIDISQWQASIKTKWGETFVIRMPREAAYLNGAMMNLDAMRQDFLWFPGGYYFQPPKDAKVVYVGTFRYYRDDFNRILRAKIIDEFSKTRQELEQQFGALPTTSRALWQPNP